MKHNTAHVQKPYTLSCSFMVLLQTIGLMIFFHRFFFFLDPPSMAMAHNDVGFHTSWQMKMYSKCAQKHMHNNAEVRTMESELRWQRMPWQNAEKRSHSRHDEYLPLHFLYLYK